ncbi:MAG: hypothetical protein AB1755_06665 [Candidatus Omnitrophota bacterium]
MYREPRPMQEIHKIQEKIYEETKDLSDRKLIEYFHRKAESAERKLGLKLRKATHIA